MEILIFKKTTDADLSKGLQVCYQDINGAFTKLGVITDILTDKDGIKNYLINTSMGAYMADELKLIEQEKKTIKANTTISARSIGDYECIFYAKVLDRKGSFVTLDIRGEVIRKKVKIDYNGNEYVKALGDYSMAPMFR